MPVTRPETAPARLILALLALLAGTVLWVARRSAALQREEEARMQAFFAQSAGREPSRAAPDAPPPAAVPLDGTPEPERRTIAIALVLGEFTISNLLSFSTVQVVIYLLGKRRVASQSEAT